MGIMFLPNVVVTFEPVVTQLHSWRLQYGNGIELHEHAQLLLLCMYLGYSAFSHFPQNLCYDIVRLYLAMSHLLYNVPEFKFEI